VDTDFDGFVLLQQVQSDAVQQGEVLCGMAGIFSTRPKYAQRCPICAAEREIRRELSSIFRLREKKKHKDT
jgi:hypothetical protein